METNYLIHHGVKGQKWGVRRYQNYDGSLIRTKELKKIKAIDKDISSFKPYEKTGIKTKRGKEVMSAVEVQASIKGLESVKEKYVKKGRKKADKYLQKLSTIRTQRIKSYAKNGKTEVSKYTKKAAPVAKKTGKKVASFAKKTGSKVSTAYKNYKNNKSRERVYMEEHINNIDRYNI